MASIICDPLEPASTSVLHRPFGGVASYRQITDRASRACVHAFPFASAPQLAAAGLLSSPGAYVLCDDRTAYFGESVRPARRLAEHAGDHSKVFSRDVFLVTGCEGSPFDKTILLDLQHRLTNLALDAGIVNVTKGVAPAEPYRGDADRASHDRIAGDALRMLFDAGCRFLRSTGDNVALARPEPGIQQDDSTDRTDSGPMSIGVSTTPVGAAEFELRYDDLWARGFWHNDHFIVSAGSEVRTTTNGSCDETTRARRDDLFRAGVLEPIPGVESRRRLVVAVAFPSIAIAAKTVSGAHTANRWTPLSRSRLVVLAGLRQPA